MKNNMLKTQMLKNTSELKQEKRQNKKKIEKGENIKVE